MRDLKTMGWLQVGERKVFNEWIIGGYYGL